MLQYKCKWVFNYYSSLATRLQKPVLTYYGASGHGKGLVDAMSGFGVKGPIRKAVITENFHYNSAEDIHAYLIDLFQGDSNKHHFLLPVESIAQNRQESHLKIKNCMKYHMIVYFPDGSIQSKVNICSCEKCLHGHFIDCPHEKGITIQNGYENTSSSCTDEESDDEWEADDIETDDDTYELYEIRSENVFNIISAGSIIALFSHHQSLELFYLCKVLDFGIASEMLHDEYNHIIDIGTKYIKCQYLEKCREQKNYITFKLLSSIVYVLPAQVMCPLVNLGQDLRLTISDYQWLSDSIGSR